MKEVKIRFKDEQLFNLIKSNAEENGLSMNQFFTELANNYFQNNEKLNPEIAVVGKVETVRKWFRLKTTTVDAIQTFADKNCRTFSHEVELRLLNSLDNSFRLLTHDEELLFRKIFQEHHNVYWNLHQLYLYIKSTGMLDLENIINTLEEVKEQVQIVKDQISELRENKSLHFYYSDTLDKNK